MVGRLVEQQQVRLAEQQLGEREAHLPAARERLGRPLEVGGREPEPLQDGRRLQLDVVAVVQPEAILQLAVAREHRVVLGFGNAGSPRRASSACISAFMASSSPKAMRRLLEHRPPRVGQAVLRQVADGQGRRLEDRARVRLVEAGHHAQQRRLARAVRPAEADALAVGDLPGDVVEENAVAERLGEVGRAGSISPLYSPSALAAAASTCGTRNGLVR